VASCSSTDKSCRYDKYRLEGLVLETKDNYAIVNFLELPDGPIFKKYLSTNATYVIPITHFQKFGENEKAHIWLHTRTAGGCSPMYLKVENIKAQKKY